MATLKQILPYGTGGNGTPNVSQAGYSPAPLIAWGQGIGTALSTFGWVKDSTPTGTVNWNTVTLSPNIRGDGQNYPSTNTLNFLGVWSNAHGQYNVSDVVTEGGMTWICSAAYTPTTASPSPSNEWRIGTQHWFLYCFEVWKSATAPTIYLRFDYLPWCFSNQTYLPSIRVKVGTSTDANGTLGTGTGQQAMGVFALGGGNNGSTNNTVSQTAQNVFEGGLPCYFSGDSTNRFAMLMWYPFDGFTGTCFFCVERSLSSTGTYYTTPSGNVTPYWSAIWSGWNNQNGNTGQVIMQSVVNIAGTTWIKTGQESTVTTLSFAGGHEVNPDNFSFWTGQGNGNQSTPAYPIWPLVGWVGNPMTAALTMRYAGNTADLPGNAGLFTQTMYGVSHTYLASRAFNSFGQFGPPSSNTGTSNYQNCMAMRYD